MEGKVDENGCITYEIPTKEIGKRLLWEGDVKQCKVDIYWDQHGRKIYDDPNDTGDPRFPPHLPVTLKNCHIKIEATDVIYFDDENDKNEYWNMYVNGSRFTGGYIQGYKWLPKSQTLKVDAPWGAG